MSLFPLGGGIMLNSSDRVEQREALDIPGKPLRVDGSGYSEEERVFLNVMADYCKSRHRRFPKFTEVLAVLKSMGYRLVAEPEPIPKLTW